MHFDPVVYLPRESALSYLSESDLLSDLSSLAAASRSELQEFPAARLERPEIVLPQGYCFAAEGEERKGDEEIICTSEGDTLLEEWKQDCAPFLTDDMVDGIYRQRKR